MADIRETITHPGTAVGALLGAVFGSWGPLLDPIVTTTIATANQWFPIAAIFSSTIGPELAPMVSWLSTSLINKLFVALAVLYVLILARKGIIKLRNR